MTHFIAPMLKRFFSHYLPVQKGVSVNTVMAYRDAIKLLLCYTADAVGHPVDALTVEDINEKNVLGFLDAIEKKRGCSKRTRNARLAAIRSLFTFIARDEPTLALQSQQIRGIPLKRAGHKSIEYLEEKELQGVSGHLKPATKERIKTSHLESNGEKVAGLPKPGFFSRSWQIISRWLLSTQYELWPSEVGRNAVSPGNWRSTGERSANT